LKNSQIFFAWRNGFLQLGQKLQKLVRKTEGILGIIQERFCKPWAFLATWLMATC
jgi:hypothetical protein